MKVTHGPIGGLRKTKRGEQRMKKTFVSILLGLFMAGLSGQAWAGSVVAADLNCANPAGCVQTNEISDGAVTEPKLANGAVTNVKLADGAVTDAKILGVISGAKLGAHGHYGSDIVDGTITSTKIADGAITDAKISGPISASKIEQGKKIILKDKWKRDKHIFDAVEKYGYRQIEIARYLDLHPSTVSNIMRGSG